MLLIRNIFSGFTNHGPSYSDKSKKLYNFTDLSSMRDSVSYGEFKKFCSANISFDIAPESKDL